MLGIGKQLKEARLYKKLSIEDIENATKIRTKYIEALEEENFKLLPGKVYVKGFIKAYAKELDLNEKELIELYESSYPKEKESKPQPIKKDASYQSQAFNKKHVTTVILGIIAIATLFGLQSFYMTFTENRDFPKSPPILQEPLPNIGEEEKTEEIEVVEEEGLDKLVLTIEVFEQSCWVRVYGDGNIVFEKTMQKGEKTVIEAQENIRITLGNAGVTRLYLGNEDLGIPGNVGQVINKTFLIEDYQ